MGVLIPVGWGQVTVPFYSTSFSRPLAITWGFDAPPDPDPVTIANEIRGTLTDTNGPFPASVVRSDTQIGPCIVQVGTEEGILSGSGTLAINGTATLGTRPPVNVALLIQKRTALGGRRNRGRLYVPPVNWDEDTIDNQGNFSSTFITAAATDWEFVLSTETAAGRGMYVLHSAPGAPTEIIDLVPQVLAATQRRRLRR